MRKQLKSRLLELTTLDVGEAGIHHKQLMQCLARRGDGWVGLQ